MKNKFKYGDIVIRTIGSDAVPEGSVGKVIEMKNNGMCNIEWYNLRHAVMWGTERNQWYVNINTIELSKAEKLKRLLYG